MICGIEGKTDDVAYNRDAELHTGERIGRVYTQTLFKWTNRNCHSRIINKVFFVFTVPESQLFPGLKTCACFTQVWQTLRCTF